MKYYDYSENGTYFITICTANREPLLSRIVPHTGPGIDLPRVELTPCGAIVEQTILAMPEHYDLCMIAYVIMPNHVHLLFSTDCKTRPPTAVPLMIGQMKRIATQCIGRPIWQKSFYDRVIRSEHEYETVWNYIDNNPAKWAEDEYYNP